MYLFFDTETTGLPKHYNAPVEQLENWPRLVQIAWLLFDGSQHCTSEKNYMIKPDGFTIPESAVKIHGITTEKALSKGADLSPVLKEFSDDMNTAMVVVGHNINFDEKIVAAEFLRKKMNHSLFDKTRICTMQSSTDFCKLPGKYGNYKWPNLKELHRKLFHEEFDGAHNAFSDVSACAKCFFELKKQGVIK
ncbi:MAG: 3'-5' exonuclease [Euryarchaeota archaeon]|nr:3'-5' exonuclease [Euryarchaeota archaeon]